MISKILPWIVGIFIVMWIIKNPAGAGDSVHGWISAALTFFSSVGGH